MLTFEAKKKFWMSLFFTSTYTSKSVSYIRKLVRTLNLSRICLRCRRGVFKPSLFIGDFTIIIYTVCNIVAWDNFFFFLMNIYIFFLNKTTRVGTRWFILQYWNNVHSNLLEAPYKIRPPVHQKYTLNFAKMENTWTQQGFQFVFVKQYNY